MSRLEGALREATKGGGLQALLDEERVARAAAEKGQREAEGVIAIERGQLAEAERGREEAQAGLAAAREESTSLRWSIQSFIAGDFRISDVFCVGKWKQRLVGGKQAGRGGGAGELGGCTKRRHEP
jgi:hypothetical protein